MIEIKKVIELLLSGSSEIRKLENGSYELRYFDINAETGEKTECWKSISLNDIDKFGLQYTGDNIVPGDPTSAVNVSLSEAATIAYPLVKYINELTDRIEDLESRLSEYSIRISNLERRINNLGG